MDTPTTAIYTLSLHDALPIFDRGGARRVDLLRLVARWRQVLDGLGRRARDLDVRRITRVCQGYVVLTRLGRGHVLVGDRKSTRLNSSHVEISYAVFCLKKKKD